MATISLAVISFMIGDPTAAELTTFALTHCDKHLVSWHNRITVIDQAVTGDQSSATKSKDRCPSECDRADKDPHEHVSAYTPSHRSDVSKDTRVSHRHGYWSRDKGAKWLVDCLFTALTSLYGQWWRLNLEPCPCIVLTTYTSSLVFAEWQRT